MLEHECGDAAVGEPLGDVVTFVGDGEVTVPAARDDEHRGVYRLVLGRKIRCERGLVDSPDGNLTASIGDDGLGFRASGGAGGAVRPKRDFLRQFSSDESAWKEHWREEQLEK
jgi:hypothetical protein